MAVDGITDDILVEILSRVPAKSLCRFKCVSKHWLGLTNDRNYLKKLPQTLTGFFYSSTTEGQFLESPIVFTSLSGSHGCPPIDTSFAFLPSHQRLNLLDCCNGLLLFRWYDVYAKDNQFLAQKKKNKKDNQFRYVVCNLATEKWTVLPDSGQADKPSTLSTACTARLGFDPAVSPHFHVFELEEEERALSSVSSPESAKCHSKCTRLKREYQCIRPKREDGFIKRRGRTNLSCSLGFGQQLFFLMAICTFMPLTISYPVV
ncbi:F-box protein At5g07610 isoform X1 [Brachypodium distachyon]|uniref:F-box protein At5g07610 isoform X1 n=1 Tax=Brachypodium distachyon TaxID=15368 RepID=UPI00052FFFEF|nr:F-box protein At5g07610 isoform X1 [Brachypodium distachyon]|eukprot:XP_010240438.1 F-box protein At5g07610 isoform X1 [Brachypodium distachyon]